MKAEELGIKWAGFIVNQRFYCDIVYLFEEYLKIGKIVKVISHKCIKTGDPTIPIEYREPNRIFICDEVLLDNGSVFRIEDVWHNGTSSFAVYDSGDNVIATEHELAEANKLKKSNRYKRIKSILRR